VRIALDRDVAPAGSFLGGTASFVNSTGRPIILGSCTALGLGGLIEVGLENQQVEFDPPMLAPLVGCNGGSTVGLPAGTSKVRFDISTTSLGCQPRSVVGFQPTPQHPLCLAGNAMPPLPAGRYVTKVILRDLPPNTPAPAPVNVELTPPVRSSVPQQLTPIGR
jgi:hypothetical protein